MKNKATIYSITVLLMLSILSTSLAVNIGKAQPTDAPTLDPSTIPKFVNQLVIPPVYVPTYSIDWKTGKIIQNYKVDMSEFYEQILPTVDENGSPTGFAQTKVWGYGGNVKDAVTGKFLGYVQNSPGPTFEAIKGIPVRVTWHNNITTPTMFAVDPTIHWANPNSMPMPPSPVTAPLFPPGYFDAQSPAALVTHLHGGEVQSYSDGGPEAWWTASGTHGPAYNTVVPASSDSAVYYYPNQQLPTTLWYHDHALGLTRINVMSGLAGFYLLRDLIDPIGRLLPSGKYEVPLAIQDRSFNLDGSLWFPSQGQNPDIHPYWYPEFFGDTIMVNGKVWPNLNVDRGQYRFRLLDGSNARFYNLTFTVQSTNPTALPFIQIGSDGGYIKSPVTLTSLLISPGERADVLVDFSSLAPGTKVVITNDAPAPYSGGDIPDPETAGQIMQFTVESTNGRRPAWLPKTLNPTLNTPLPNTAGTKRILPLVEIEGENGPLMVTLNGQSYDGVLTETPRVGSTEDWYIVNLTPDWHPIHLHLTQFQLVKRIPFDADAYKDAWNATNGFQSLPFPTGYEPIEVDPLLYRTGPDVPLTANEMAWKDTVQAPNGTITVLRIRFAPQSSPITGRGSPTPGVNQYPFDPTIGPGYVWHCHIVDHEDNEMMRPYKVVP